MPRIFNGVYTLRNRNTGEHRTFKVSTQAEDARFAAGKRILSLLTGPDRFKGFAFIQQDERINVWTRYRGQNGKKSAQDWFAIMLWAMTTPEGEDTPVTSEYKVKYDLMVEKRCVRCNRRLTHPESLVTGIGPDCAGRGNNSPVVDPTPAVVQPVQPRQSKPRQEKPAVDAELDDPEYNVPTDGSTLPVRSRSERPRRPYRSWLTTATPIAARI